MEFKSSVYQEELDQYYERINNLTQAETDEYLGVNYKAENCHDLYPEFLDFIDEWEWHFNEQLKRTTVDYIVRVLGRRGQRIQCKDHFHYFTTMLEKNRCQTQPRDAEEVIVSSDMTIDPYRCWFKTITDDIGLLKSADKVAVSRPPKALEGFFQRMLSIRMTQQQLPPRKITFETFKKVWWDSQPDEKSVEMLRRELGLIGNEANEVLIETVKLKRLLPTPTNFGTRRIIMDTDKVIEDHGLHTLLASIPEPQNMIDYLNVRRATLNPKEVIGTYELAQAINNCKWCKQMIHRQRSPSLPGIYYAPPGAGKSYALAAETFIGIDTDWLHDGINVTDIYLPLRQGIPILTNQYSAFQNSGMKIIGWFNTDRLRKIPNSSRPWTSLEEIIRAQNQIGPDLSVTHTTGHHNVLSRGMNSMLFRQYIQVTLIEEFLSTHDQFQPSLYASMDWKTLERKIHDLPTVMTRTKRKKIRRKKR